MKMFRQMFRSNRMRHFGYIAISCNARFICHESLNHNSENLYFVIISYFTLINIAYSYEILEVNI